MRDLNIRGAGNLLGKQQHGFIDSVGFDLYSQMLEEAVNEKRSASSMINVFALGTSTPVSIMVVVTKMSYSPLIKLNMDSLIQ